MMLPIFSVSVHSMQNSGRETKMQNVSSSLHSQPIPEDQNQSKQRFFSSLLPSRNNGIIKLSKEKYEKVVKYIWDGGITW